MIPRRFPPKLGGGSGSSHRQNCPSRQILPGRLRLVNQKKAKLAPVELREITMRIYGPNGTLLGFPAANARRSSWSGFCLPEAGAAPETRVAGAPKRKRNIDPLLALQGIE